MSMGEVGRRARGREMEMERAREERKRRMRMRHEGKGELREESTREAAEHERGSLRVAEGQSVTAHPGIRSRRRGA